MSTERTAWTFVTPALIVIGGFFAVPVLAAFVLSLTDFDLYALADLRNLRFVGFGNYLDVLRAPLFWKSLLNTLYFVGVGVPLSIGASLGAALLLNSPLARAKGFFRPVRVERSPRSGRSRNVPECPSTSRLRRYAQDER